MRVLRASDSAVVEVEVASVEGDVESEPGVAVGAVRGSGGGGGVAVEGSTA